MHKLRRLFLPRFGVHYLFLAALRIVGVIRLLFSDDRPEPRARILLGERPWPVHCLAFAPDGKVLAVGGGFPDPEAEVNLWDVATGTVQTTLRGHEKSVYSLTFAPDGQTLATAGFDRVVKLWDVASGRERASLIVSPESGSLFMAFSPASQALALAGDEPGVLRLWRLSVDPERPLVAGSGPFVFRADGRGLTFWRTAPGPASAGRRPEMTCLAPNGALSKWPAVEIRNVAIGEQRFTLGDRENCVAALAFSPDGQTLAAPCYDSTIKLWEVSTRRERTTLRGHADQVNAVAFAPDGKLLASASHDRTVRLWDLASASERAIFHGHAGAITSVAFSPDGQWVASGSYDKTVRLWLVDKGG
jgi:WD40 repeat protein